MYNKRKFNKINDKKILHKVKKQWVTISLALFMMIGGGAVATHVSASANTTNNQNQQQVSVKLGNKKSNKNTITNKAKALHQNLLSKASVNKPTNNKLHKQINTTHQGNLVTVNNKPAKKVSNINKIRMHKANLYHGYVYNQINKPFQNLKINHTVELHSSIDFRNSQSFGFLRPGNTVKANRMFKQFGHSGNYLRYEININHKRTAFITGNNHFVSYIIPVRSYKYYQNKVNKLVHKANYKNSKKISKQLHKLNKQRTHSFSKYANLYEMAFNAQQRAKYPITVDYNNKKRATKNTNITPISNATSVVSSATSTPSYNYIPAIPSYIAPVSYSNSAVMPSPTSKSKSISSSVNSALINAFNKDNTSAQSYVNEANNDTKNSNLSLQSNYVSEANSYDTLVNNEASSIHNYSLTPNSSNLTSANSAVQSASTDVSNENNVVSEANSYANNPLRHHILNDINQISNYQNGVINDFNEPRVQADYTIESEIDNDNNSISSMTSGLRNSLSNPTSDVANSADNDVNNAKSLLDDANTLVPKAYHYVDANNSDEWSKVTDWKQASKPYHGLNYKYAPGEKAIEFTSGTLNNSDFNISDNGGLMLGAPRMLGATKQLGLTLNVTGSDIKGAKSIKFDKGIDTSKVTNMSGMFQSDSDLESLNLGPSFNTSNVTDMHSMFENDRALKTLSLPESFNTSNVANMEYMFQSDVSLDKLVLPTTFDTRKAAHTWPGMGDGLAWLFTNAFAKGAPLVIQSPNTFVSDQPDSSGTNTNAYFNPIVPSSELFDDTNLSDVTKPISDGYAIGLYTSSNTPRIRTWYLKPVSDINELPLNIRQEVNKSGDIIDDLARNDNDPFSDMSLGVSTRILSLIHNINLNRSVNYLDSDVSTVDNELEKNHLSQLSHLSMNSLESQLIGDDEKQQVGHSDNVTTLNILNDLGYSIPVFHAHVNPQALISKALNNHPDIQSVANTLMTHIGIDKLDHAIDTMVDGVANSIGNLVKSALNSIKIPYSKGLVCLELNDKVYKYALPKTSIQSVYDNISNFVSDINAKLNALSLKASIAQGAQTGIDTAVATGGNITTGAIFGGISTILSQMAFKYTVGLTLNYITGKLVDFMFNQADVSNDIDDIVKNNITSNVSSDVKNKIKDKVSDIKNLANQVEINDDEMSPIHKSHDEIEFDHIANIYSKAENIVTTAMSTLTDFGKLSADTLIHPYYLFK